MNDLIQGRTLRIQDADVLLGLSSWHLYPDLAVQTAKSQFVKQSDPLIKHGGIITLGLLKGSTDNTDGIYWSLPLAHLRFYGDPIVSTGCAGFIGSQVSLQQFLCVILGDILDTWNVMSHDWELTFKLIIVIAECLSDETDSEIHMTQSQLYDEFRWIHPLASAANFFLQSSGTDRQNLRRLIKYGQRHCSKFIIPSDEPLPLLFGLCKLELLLSSWERFGIPSAGRTHILRHYLENTYGNSGVLTDAIIETGDAASTTIWYIDLYPENRQTKKDLHEPYDISEFLAEPVQDEVEDENSQAVSHCSVPSKRKFIEDDPISLQEETSKPPLVWSIPSLQARRRVSDTDEAFALLPPGPNEDPIEFQFFCGVPLMTAVYVQNYTQDFDRPISPSIRLSDLHDFLEQGIITRCQLRTLITGSDFYKLRTELHRSFSSLNHISLLEEVYLQLSGAKIDLHSASKPIRHLAWLKNLPKDQHLPPENVFSCITYFETGYLNLEPASLKDCLALSCNDSLYVSSRLLMDPFEIRPKIAVTRMIGNIGKPGVSLLVSPANPRVLQLGPESWKVVAHDPFDGSVQDCFTSTSLHLSLTGYELDMVSEDSGSKGARDPDARIIEATISLHDRGKWIADLDILNADKEWKKTVQHRGCIHTSEEKLDTSHLPPLVSVENWYEFLDKPPSSCIVHTHKNSMARLATMSLAFQMSQRFFVVPPDTCWKCVASHYSVRTGDFFMPSEYNPIQQVHALPMQGARYERRNDRIHKSQLSQTLVDADDGYDYAVNMGTPMKPGVQSQPPDISSWEDFTAETVDGKQKPLFLIV